MISLLLALTLQAETRTVAQPLAADDLEVRLYSDQKEFLVGEPIEITVVVRNRSDRDLILPTFSFRYPNRWESVSVAGEDQDFLPADGGAACRWPSVFNLEPGGSEAFGFTLNDLHTGAPAQGAIRVQVSLNIRAGTFCNGDVVPPGVPITVVLETGFTISSEVLEVRVNPPVDPADVAVHDWLMVKWREPDGWFAHAQGFMPCFEEAFYEIYERILHFHPHSHYAVHVRNQQCRWAITELRKGTVEELLAQISTFELGPFEDNRLLEAYQALANSGRHPDPASLQPILDRLRDRHPNSDGFQRARACGLL